VNVALPTIASGLGASVSGLQWVVDGYALALASLMLAGGAVGDLRGHKGIVLAGLVVFGVGSLGCGTAPGVELLVACRVVQGVGAALLLPGTLAIISRAFPEGPEKAKAIGIWAGIGSLALPAGPLLGGALIDAFGWRAIFLINVPIVLVAGFAAAPVVRESSDPRGRRLDVLGVALGVSTLLAATFAFIEAGRSGAGSPAVLVSAAAAVLALGALAVAAPSTLATAQERLNSIGAYGHDDSVRYRLVESRFVYGQVREHPLAGAGLGASIFWGQPWASVPPKTRTYSHDGYLWISWKLGIPAAALLVLLLAGSVLSRTRRDEEPLSKAVRRGAQGAIIGLLVATFTFPSFSQLSIAPVIGLLLALAIAPQVSALRSRRVSYARAVSA
jgi:MFS family permease